MTAWRFASRVEGYRSSCEDVVGIRAVGESLVVAVADGAGGRSGGRAAADMAVDRLLSEMEARPATDPLALLVHVDGLILEDPEAGETTAVLAVLSPDGIRGAAVGDSGAWFVTDGEWHDLTGHAERKPFLGSGAAMPAPFSSGRLPGTLLVATDGLLKYTSAERICEAVRQNEDLEAACDACVDRVRLRSGKLQDDVGLVLVRSA